MASRYGAGKLPTRVHAPSVKMFEIGPFPPFSQAALLIAVPGHNIKMPPVLFPVAVFPITEHNC